MTWMSQVGLILEGEIERIKKQFHQNLKPQVRNQLIKSLSEEKVLIFYSI